MSDAEEEVAKAIFNAPCQIWESSSELTRSYYQVLAGRALKGARAVLAVTAQQMVPSDYRDGLMAAVALLDGQ